jgi:hypothetical protein
LMIFFPLHGFADDDPFSSLSCETLANNRSNGVSVCAPRNDTLPSSCPPI